MQLLQFNCPGCSQQLLYDQFLKHIESCAQCEQIKKEGRKPAEPSKGET